MHSNQMEFKVQNVEYLQRVKEKAIDRITISMNTDLLDNQVVADLNEIIHSNPGKTQLFFQLRDSRGINHVLLRSKTCGWQDPTLLPVARLARHQSCAVAQ